MSTEKSSKPIKPTKVYEHLTNACQLLKRHNVLAVGGEATPFEPGEFVALYEWLTEAMVAVDVVRRATDDVPRTDRMTAQLVDTLL